MKKLPLVLTVVIIIVLFAFLSQNQQLKNVKAENSMLKAELTQNDSKKAGGINQTIADDTLEITVNDLLNGFKEWEGNKEPNNSIYTLNLNNDTYILTIKPNTNDFQQIDWVEIIYIKPIRDGTTISPEEVAPMHKLASSISAYWDKNEQWRNSIIDGQIPYEETIDDWKLKTDYYIYQGKKMGITINIANLGKSSPPILLQENNLSKSNIYSGSEEDKISAWAFAQDAVKENLRAPSTAKFPWYDKSYVTPLSDGRYLVKAYVDAENSFGAKLRSNFSVKIRIKGENSYTYAEIQID